jgi:co-chaperonin GroES (HSP10)
MFQPVNRYILIEIQDENENKTASGVILPDDFKVKDEKFVVANVISWAHDVRFTESLSADAIVIVDKSMVEEVNVNNQLFTIIQDNYVVGITVK